MILDLDNHNLDTIAVALNSTAQRTFTFQIDCFTGHFAYNGVIDADGIYRQADPIPDAVIEFRVGTIEAYTDIETTPYDLSAFNGERKTCQLRITAGTITAAHLVRSMQLMVGPEPVALTFLTNDGGDLLTNDSGAYLIA